MTHRSLLAAPVALLAASLLAASGVSRAEPFGTATLTIVGDDFRINGQSKFLLGVSYFDARNWSVADLDGLAQRNVNNIRIWTRWPGLKDNDDNSWGWNETDSFINPVDGHLRYASELLALVRAAHVRGLTVDVTVMYVDPAESDTFYENAMRDVAGTLKNEPNVFYSIINEHNSSQADENITHARLGQLIDIIVAQDVNALVTYSSKNNHLITVSASCPAAKGAEIDGELNSGVNALAPHFGRVSNWYDLTDCRVAAIKGYVGNVPLFLEEENRRDEGAGSGATPTYAHFLQAANEAQNAGAAGWIFHTTAGYDMTDNSFMSDLDAVEAQVLNDLGWEIFGLTATITTPDDVTSEPGTNTAKFRIQLNRTRTTAVTVNYTIAGGATNGVDYDPIGTSVTIPAGQLSADVLIRPRDDAAHEGTEQVRLTLTNSPGYTVGSLNAARIAINDND